METLPREVCLDLRFLYNFIAPRFGAELPVKRLRKIWVDGAYPAAWLEEWVRGLKQTHKIDLEATTHQEGKGFQVVPWRWAVERTFAWLLNNRRHSKDYERLTANSAAMIQISMIRLLLNRLA